jgi:hypothetical protein
VRAAQTALVHLLLEAASLTASGINAAQAFRKSPSAWLTVETATGEVDEHPPFAHI